MADPAASSSSAGGSTSTQAIAPRYDFYQTQTTVNVSVYVKGVQQDQLKLNFAERELSLHIDSSAQRYELQLPLYAPIDATASSYKILGTKIDIALTKAHPGLQWADLKGDAGAAEHGAKLATISAGPVPMPISSSSSSTAAAAAAAAAAQPAASSGPRRSKWDSFQPEETAEDAAAEDFFKQLYRDSDENTRKAMIKSYQESGGTSLSTNWAEVGKQRVEVRPPEGMIAKKYGA